MRLILGHGEQFALKPGLKSYAEIWKSIKVRMSAGPGVPLNERARMHTNEFEMSIWSQSKERSTASLKFTLTGMDEIAALFYQGNTTSFMGVESHHVFPLFCGFL
jgi:hypothetical protein